MRPRLSRLFLLLLVAIDWATDPSQGTSPLSQPWGNTETVCCPVNQGEELVRLCVPSPCLQAAAPFHFSAPDCMCAAVAVLLPSAPCRIDLLYVFMSIQQ